MKIYQETIVDGMFTVPDLHLDWEDLLSDQYKLWQNYKYALLKFYYSPNHEGSCTNVAQEFNDKPSSLNALIMNFGRAVQKTVGNFSVVRNNKMQYWIISMDGYYDEKNHFVWRLKPELVAAIKKNQERDALLKEKFLKRFPLDSLRSMTIDEYTNLNRKNSFCYWLESETYRLGSIWGGSSLKFGIYQYDQIPKEGMPAIHDDKYCWLSKYNCETSDEAFNLVRNKIVTIAEKASEGDLRGVDAVDFGDAVKWKIACLYSDNKVINMYTKELLQAAAKGFGFKGDLNSRPEMNEFITSQYDKDRESFFDFYWRVGIHYFGKSDPARTYWLAGYSFGSTNSQLDRFIKEGIWESKHDDKNKSDQKILPLAQSISEGDIIILKSTSTKGNSHDQPFLRIKAVGIVTSNIETNKIENSTFCRCSVNYVNIDEKDFDGAVYGSYRKTLHQADKKIKEVIDYVNSLIPKEDMPTQEAKHEQPKEYKKYIDLLYTNHNLILTGAPGTGKTYMAKAIAEAMKAECEFVQFHPSYDYTDFVEGLRPIQEVAGEVGFERKDGVFKEFCAKALQNLLDSKKSIQALQTESSVRDLLESFIQDSMESGTKFETSGTKNAFYIIDNKEKSIIVKIPANEKTSEIALPKSDLTTLLENKVPISGGGDIQSYFKRKYRTQPDSYVYVLYNILRKKSTPLANTVSVALVPEKKFVFIIDEINRGEISKIFGELFFSIDPGYRGIAGRVKTQYQNLIEEGDVFKDGFYVPENVYIIGTMNDIDRSVESMDFAMRRRFAWAEVTAEESMQMLNGIANETEIKTRMRNLNNAILKVRGLGEAYQIGAAYFKKIEDYEGDFQKLWDFHLKGLLYEYLRGNMNAAEQLKELKKAYDNNISSDGATNSNLG